MTITAVDVDREFEKARVYYTTVDGEDENDPMSSTRLSGSAPKRGGP